MRRRALLMGGAREESAFIPVLETLRFNVMVSTRVGKSFANFNDGSPLVDLNLTKNVNYYNVSYAGGTYYEKNYASNFSGNIEVIFKKGLKDVYSIAIYKSLRANTSNDDVTDKYNIPDVAAYLSQFPKLHSVLINLYGYGNNNRRARLYGDLALIPNWIKEVKVLNCDVIGFPDTLYLDIDKYTSNSDLEFFHQENSTAAAGNTNKLKIVGDLKNLPPNIHYFRTSAPHPSLTSLTYTSGRVWRSDFDSLRIAYIFSSTEIDNILIDLAASVITAVGEKTIALRGARTSASDSAVSYLEGLGFTVTVTP